MFCVFPFYFFIWEAQDRTLIEGVKWVVLKRRNNWRNKVPETDEERWEPEGGWSLERRTPDPW